MNIYPSIEGSRRWEIRNSRSSLPILVEMGSMRPDLKREKVSVKESTASKVL